MTRAHYAVIAILALVTPVGLTRWAAQRGYASGFAAGLDAGHRDLLDDIISLPVPTEPGPIPPALPADRFGFGDDDPPFTRL